MDREACNKLFYSKFFIDEVLSQLFEVHSSCFSDQDGLFRLGLRCSLLCLDLPLSYILEKDVLFGDLVQGQVWEEGCVGFFDLLSIVDILLFNSGAF